MAHRRIVPPLAALFAVAAVNWIAACVPGDDGDLFEAPEEEPTPAPEPEVEARCQIVWTQPNPDEPGTLIDLFAVDGPRELWWGNATHGFDDFLGVFATAVVYEGHSVDPNDVLIVTTSATVGVVTTDGEFTLNLTVNGPTAGAKVIYDDADANDLRVFGTGTSLIGVNDQGLFDGNFSSEDPDDPLDLENVAFVDITLGTAATMTIGGDPETGSRSFAVCYEVEGGAEISAAKALTTLRRFRRE